MKDPAEAIFEGITMLLAAGILTWMIFWMSQRARNMKAELESSVQRASQAGKWSLFGLAFIAVLREGVELALFLTAATFSSSAPRRSWARCSGSVQPSCWVGHFLQPPSGSTCGVSSR